MSNASLVALNIFNGVNGTITTALPTGGLAGYANAIGNLSLTLTAINTIVNQGQIIGGGTVNVVANSVTNSGVIQAANNLSVLSSSIVNSGTLAAITGSVNLANPAQYAATVQSLSNTSLSALLNSSMGSVVNITNTGVIEALAGSVNIGGDLGGGALSAIAGEIRTNAVNFDAGPNGALEVADLNTGGSINVTAGVARVLAETPLLRLGNIKIDGDPTFFNSGNIA